MSYAIARCMRDMSVALRAQETMSGCVRVWVCEGVVCEGVGV